MAADTALEFDLGPLTWVQGEIDQALSKGLESLATFKASPSDTTALKHARAHVHQAAGAIQMVGLDAIGAYTEELERQLNRLEELSPSEVIPACELVDRACRRLKIFLGELVGGVHPVPLKLFPEYELMQQARGHKAVAPTDLFYPDLSVRAPNIAPLHAIPSQQLSSFLVKQRRLFQRGLLAWLRGDEEGARLMRDAVQGIQRPANGLTVRRDQVKAVEDCSELRVGRPYRQAMNGRRRHDQGHVLARRLNNASRSVGIRCPAHQHTSHWETSRDTYRFPGTLVRHARRHPHPAWLRTACVPESANRVAPTSARHSTGPAL